MKKLFYLLVAVVEVLVATTFAEEHPKIAPLSAQESLSRIRVPEGYRVELVAAEPTIEEPVMCTWDARGRMYVAEMRSFMQDTKGTGTFDRSGRIKQLEDTDGDGVLDRSTVFADDLIAPRMILPLDDRVVIQETGDSTLFMLRDTDDDGRADERSIVWKGVKAHDSIEHQDSGLLWNIDNWLYTAEGGWRHRFTRGVWESEECEAQQDNQWGLGMDDVGTLYFSHNSYPGRSFQQPWYAWSLLPFKTGPKHLRPRLGPTDTDAAFHRIYPIHKIGDRANRAGQEFTSACGISIYRGDALPDLQGNMMICEPCSHIVRCAKVEVHDGKKTLRNAFEDREFFASDDFYCRPVWTATGPDGCLYVVDMYRGIIQDRPWVDTNFAKRIVDMGADQVKQRGRIWRIVPDVRSSKSGSTTDAADADRAQPPTTETARPSLTARKSALDLLPLLAHANGFWRDAAQRLIVLQRDRTVIEPLVTMSGRHAKPIARLHALWTLEGLDALEKPVVFSALEDPDPRVRAAAVRLCEPWLKQNDAETHSRLDVVTSDAEIEVLRQLTLSLGRSSSPEAVKSIENIVLHHLDNEIIYLATMTALWGRQTPLMKRLLAGGEFQRVKDVETRDAARQRWKSGLTSWVGQQSAARPLDAEAIELVNRGATIYLGLCASCHGLDGKGLQPPGSQALAPPLDGSARVRGQKERLARILLQGLEGDLDGKQYRGGVMASMGTLDDGMLAAVMTYIRQSWTNDEDPIYMSDVAEVRRASATRQNRWTQAELDEYEAPLLADSQTTAAKKEKFPFKCYRGDSNHDQLGRELESSHPKRGPWIHGPMVPGHWFAVDLLEPYEITSIMLDPTYDTWFPRGWELRISDDGRQWSQPVASGKGTGGNTKISLEPTVTRFFKIVQTSQPEAVDKHGRRADVWDVKHIRVYGRSPRSEGETPSPSRQGAPLPLDAVGRLSTDEAIAKTLASIATGKVDAEAGGALFQKLQCNACHATKPDEPGKGPFLGKSSRTLKREELMTAILEPSKTIAPDFVTTLFVLNDGRVESGFVIKESDDAVTIRNSTAQELTLLKKDVDERQKLDGVSLMPTGLASKLTVDEFAMLVKYLEWLGVDNGKISAGLLERQEAEPKDAPTTPKPASGENCSEASDAEEARAAEEFPQAGAVQESREERQPAGPAVKGNKPDKLKGLVIDGENNHDFRGTTDAIRGTLATTGRFGDWSHVRYSRSPLWWEQPQPPRPRDPDPAVQAKFDAEIKIYAEARAAYSKQMELSRSIWDPPFADYDVVIINYNGNAWPEKVREAFVEFIRNGGGAVVVHAANNSFADWPAYNEMLGIGWRGSKFGHWIAVDDATGKLIKVPEENPQGSSHGDFLPFVVKTRDTTHPITAGLPSEWMHGADELYVRMRGTTDNLHVLATAQAPGTKQHEPVLWYTRFGKGRVVTTSLGHYQRPAHYSSLNCVGFQTILARSCEWAATEKVTIPVPVNFPTATQESIAPPKKVEWKP